MEHDLPHFLMGSYASFYVRAGQKFVELTDGFVDQTWQMACVRSGAISRPGKPWHPALAHPGAFLWCALSKSSLTW